jgi:putative tricarboxylic transport membrane protein
VLMAAMLIHNLNPGPNLMLQTPEFFYQIVAMLLIADMSKLFYGLTLVRPLLWILLVPRERLMPIVFVLCVVGSYAITSRVFDIYVMLFFGFLGFILRELKFPMAPLILGLVLGDLLEKNMTRGLVLSDGSILPFLTRPVSSVLAAITIFSILWSFPGFHRWVVGLFRRRSAGGAAT